MTERQKTLVDLKARRFSVNIPKEDYDRLTALAIRNCLARGTMAWFVLHNALDADQHILEAYYQRLSREQGGRSIAAIEHEILGHYKRLARSGVRDMAEYERIELSLSLPSYDNRRLIGHASLFNLSKSEMCRVFILPKLRKQDENIAKFWDNACKHINKPLDETKALFIADFDAQGR